MKTTYFIVLIMVLECFSSVSAQDLQGKIYYVSKTNIDNNLGRRQQPEAQQTRQRNRQNQASTKTHELVFNANTSLFSETVTAEQTIQQEGGRGGGGRGGYRQLLLNQSSGTYFADIETKTYIAQKEIYGKQFLIQDSLPSLNWQRTDEVKNIGKYLCFKAETKILKKSYDTNIPDKEIIITAWYTIEIPVAIGPETYYGLPGAILELHTENRVYLCSKIELNSENTIEINPPKKGKKISQEKFDELLAEKAKKVKELSQRGRSGGSGRN